MTELPYHLSITIVSRKLGQCCAEKASYNSGSKMRDCRTGQVFNYQHKRVLHHELRQVEGVVTSDDSAELQRIWDTIESSEKRRDSRVAREAKLALPHVLDPAINLELVRSFADWLVRRYSIFVHFAIHPASQMGDPRNVHAHLLFPTRSFVGGVPGAKHRVLDSAVSSGVEIQIMRHCYMDLCNAYLQEFAPGHRVDSRSYADRGIKKVPGRHNGPKRTWLRRMGKLLDRFEDRVAELETVARDLPEEFVSIDEVECAVRELCLVVSSSKSESPSSTGMQFVRVLPTGLLGWEEGFGRRFGQAVREMKRRPECEDGNAIVLRDLLGDAVATLLTANDILEERRKEREEAERRHEKDMDR